MICLCKHRDKASGAPTLSPNDVRSKWVVSTTPRLLYPRERVRSSGTGGWVSLGEGLDGTKIHAATGTVTCH